VSASAAVATITAPAKLTLSLRITGVRSDGYHLLDAEMVSIDLEDTVEIARGSEVSVIDETAGGCDLGEVPTGSTNLVAKALALLGISAAVRIRKRIPPGAGLGGGSADAAAILRWAGSDDTAAAARLGADVPFCLAGGRARVTGIGDVIEPLPFHERRFVLMIPPLAVSTEAAYRMWDERRIGQASTPEDDAPPLNDLEEAALEVEPRLRGWRDLLCDLTGKRPMLAGSGSTWFVEGEPRELGLDGLRHLLLDGRRAALVDVRTLPSQIR
jgi:4-diphosphocytidyl-2-C-methyl-D-erythritol kinase